MKITGFKHIYASKYLFLEIYTDIGIKGIGEVGAWGFLDGVSGVLQKLEGYLIGKDPMEIERHWQYMYRSMFFRGVVIMSAISAIDIALWDIKGKYFDVPCYELMGGKCRDRVRTYPAIFEFTPEDMAAACLKLKEQGFTAARLMITQEQGKRADKNDMIFSAYVSKQVEKVKACRNAVGNSFDLILEIHRSMNPAEALTFAKAVEQYDPFFLEDPIGPDNENVLADIASRTSVPIATGERFINFFEFQKLLQIKGAMYIRPDVCVVGGLTACKKIASIAESYYVDMVPHNPLGPVSTAACLQLDAAVPNIAIQEFPSFYMQEGEKGMIKEPFEVEDGFIVVPKRPGIGIELSDDVQELFPAKQRSLWCHTSFDGFIKDV